MSGFRSLETFDVRLVGKAMSFLEEEFVKNTSLVAEAFRIEPFEALSFDAWLDSPSTSAPAPDPEICFARATRRRRAGFSISAVGDGERESVIEVGAGGVLDWPSAGSQSKREKGA